MAIKYFSCRIKNPLAFRVEDMKKAELIRTYIPLDMDDVTAKVYHMELGDRSVTLEKIMTPVNNLMPIAYRAHDVNLRIIGKEEAIMKAKKTLERKFGYKLEKDDPAIEN